MHELSLCNSIYQIADRARGGRPVEVIHLRVGELRQVVPETLVYCWGLVAAQTPLAGSELRIEHVPVELRCTACAARTVVSGPLELACAACGTGRVEVVAGEELVLTALELSERPCAARPEEGHG